MVYAVDWILYGDLKINYFYWPKLQTGKYIDND